MRYHRLHYLSNWLNPTERTSSGRSIQSIDNIETDAGTDTDRYQCNEIEASVSLSTAAAGWKRRCVCAAAAPVTAWGRLHRLLLPCLFIYLLKMRQNILMNIQNVNTWDCSHMGNVPLGLICYVTWLRGTRWKEANWLVTLWIHPVACERADGQRIQSVTRSERCMASLRYWPSNSSCESGWGVKGGWISIHGSIQTTFSTV